MGKIALIIVGLVILYSVTIIAPVVCDDSLFSKWGFCYWFYNRPIIVYSILIILLIVSNGLVRLIKKKK